MIKRTIQKRIDDYNDGGSKCPFCGSHNCFDFGKERDNLLCTATNQLVPLELTYEYLKNREEYFCD